MTIIIITMLILLLIVKYTNYWEWHDEIKLLLYLKRGILKNITFAAAIFYTTFLHVSELRRFDTKTKENTKRTLYLYNGLDVSLT